ncbi:MAG: multicopper oxidase domain-containing protein, partial [Chloroflexota bacterium]
PAAGQANAAPAAAQLPATPCTDQGGGLYRCELWARAGSLDLPGPVSVPVWGYSSSAAGPAELPGPVLIVPQGAQVEIVLHNDLAGPTSLRVDGQALRTGPGGIAPGAQQTYSFTAADPGVFLYEAGAFPNGPVQVAMGLYGGLVVRSSTPGQAYANPASAFDGEALLVLSEIDPALHTSADPAQFDLRAYRPRYWLINGKAYPQTDLIDSAAGQRLLLRYLNAGQQTRTMTVLGLYQQTLALSGAELPHYRSVASENLGPGQSADALLALPASAPAGAKYPLYEAGLLLHNNGASGFGGMLTFITTAAGAPGPDLAGPAVSGLSLTPSISGGGQPVIVTASISDAASGGAAVTAAEYFIDAPGAAGAGMPLDASDNAFDSPVEAASATIQPAELAGLASGKHTIYVHGQDANGNWGAFNLATLNLDLRGPLASGIVFTPPVSRGDSAVTLRASASDAGRGGSNVSGGEYFIDIDPLAPPAPGSGAPLPANQAAPVVSLDGSIPAAVMSGLSEGPHTLFLRARDDLLNWGEWVTATLAVDRSGPQVTSLALSPAFTGGAAPVRVDAVLQDLLPAGAVSNIAAAELFIDQAGARGSGLPLGSRDGAFDALSEAVYGLIPQNQVASLSQGQHTILVRGRDAAGSWGALSSTSLTVDTARPVVSGAAASPASLPNSASFQLTANASDLSMNIVAAEWFRLADPGLGRGMPMQAADGSFDSLAEAVQATVSAFGWPSGSHSLYVRVKDASGNWSLPASTVVQITPSALLLVDGFETGGAVDWTGAGSPALGITAQAAIQGRYGLQASLEAGKNAFLADRSPAGETTYHARFYVNPRQTVTGQAQVDLFTANDASGQAVLRVQYRKASATGAAQLRLLAVHRGGVAATRWFTISGSQAHAVEIDWQSSRSAVLRLYVDGSLARSLSGLDTSRLRIESVRLGLVSGIRAGMSGSIYFDAFIARRDRYIGK